MPFAVISGVIAGVVEVMSEGAEIRAHLHTVVPHAGVGGVPARLQVRSRRIADGLASEPLTTLVPYVAMRSKFGVNPS